MVLIIRALCSILQNYQRNIQKQLIKLLIILFSAIYLFGAAEFKVISFEKNGMDLTARKKSTRHIDVNGNECALVKVQTDMKDLMFESTLLEKSLPSKGGEYWVYLPKNAKRLKLKKEGIISKIFTFPNKLEESTVYILKLTAEGFENNIDKIGINIITNKLF